MSDVPAVYAGAHRFAFGDTAELADELLALVLSGKKTATCGALRDFDETTEPMPRVGRRDVVLDGAGRPAAVIETTEVATCRFDEVDEAFALAEGEGSYVEWREAHEIYFDRNGGVSPDLKVVCERFRLVEVLPRPGLPPTVIDGWAPGLIGAVTRAHGEYYAQRWNFPAAFEAYVAREFGAFVARMQPGRDLCLSAWEGGELLGTISMDGAGPEVGPGEMQLRFFIVTAAARGRGLGRTLLDQALSRSDATGARRTVLTTFAGLETARALYESAGFRLIREAEGESYGRVMLEQCFERVI